MRLQLISPYQSINSLISPDMPDFVVLTGPNGSGKTHLLRGIESGQISVDGLKKDGAQARFFDATNIVPANSGSFSSQTLKQLRVQTIARLEQYKAQLRQDLLDNYEGLISKLRVLDKNNTSLDPLDLINSEEVDDQYTDLKVYPEFSHTVTVLRERRDAVHPTYMKNNGVTPGLVRFSEQKGISLWQISASDLDTEAIDLWGEVNVFQQNLGQLFVAYRDMLLMNDLKHNKRTRTGDETIRVYSVEEFVKRYGEPPWDFLNKLFIKARLPFQINKPSEFDYDDYLPQITKTNTNAILPFSSLSGGERVLMSFALCLYQARDVRQAVQYPELLLFDEIDAPLHPSMVKDIVDTINDVLVGERHIKVIMTTHSHTTVAIAPESAVYVIRDSKRIEKCTKEAALRLLTIGVPTLSISFDARRQVLVESRIDAQILDGLYRQLRPRLEVDISLEFIAASGAEKSENSNNEPGGADIVKSLVKQLAEAGNQSIYGLVDWDLKSTHDHRLRVLACGTRYSLDNCILDPCLIGLLICKDSKAEAVKLNLMLETENYPQLIEATSERMQELSNTVSTQLGYSDYSVNCNYIGQKTLLHPSDLLHGNGHELSRRILETFKFLRANCRNQTALLFRILNNVVSDSPHWIPSEIIEAFTDLVKPQE
jgi:energy-coupling factor transporter ATP-binding protein EcfA2